MEINYEKVMRILSIMGLIFLGIALLAPNNYFYIGAGVFWIAALYFYWRYRKQ